MDAGAKFKREWAAANRLRDRATKSIVAEHERPNGHQFYYSDADADADFDGYLAISRLISDVVDLERKLEAARKAAQT